jgi:hypothetical protein
MDGKGKVNFSSVFDAWGQVIAHEQMKMKQDGAGGSGYTNARARGGQ